MDSTYVQLQDSIIVALWCYGESYECKRKDGMGEA